ncbi:MAG: hypothetical protein MUF42_13995 [Cytophagaceae bacterium]|nr:hypothetical protein [Cytophagaceae bacterium]
MTERVNDTSVYRLGNRPLKGTKLLTMGLNLSGDNSGFDNLNLIGKGSVITGKFFIKDNVAIRAGLKLTKESSVSGGENGDTSTAPATIVKNSYKSVEREFAIVPGIEYHFSNSNFFDVYTGADLHLGLSRDFTRNEVERYNKDFNNVTRRTKTTDVGLGGVIGVNMFILDLPISVGFEYGLAGIWSFGGKTKVVSESKTGNVTTNEEYFTQDEDALGNSDGLEYSKLRKSSTSIETNNNLRVILNIYFK